MATNPLDSFAGSTRTTNDFKVPLMPKAKERVEGAGLLEGLSAFDREMEGWRGNTERQLNERLSSIEALGNPLAAYVIGKGSVESRLVAVETEIATLKKQIDNLESKPSAASSVPADTSALALLTQRVAMLEAEVLAIKLGGKYLLPLPRVTTIDLTVPSFYSVVLAEDLEIGTGLVVELETDGVLAII